MLTNNPKPSNEEYYSNLKFQENRIKTEIVTVLSLISGSRSIRINNHNNNPKPSNEEYYSNLKFRVNWIKTVTMTVLLFFGKYGGPDVISYVDEPKRTQLNI